MNRRKRYFIKQKLIGVGIVLFAIFTIFALDGDATAALLIGPIGIYMMFSKEEIWMDNYFFEVREEKEEEL